MFKYTLNKAKMKDYRNCYRKVVLWFLTIIHFFVDVNERFLHWFETQVNYKLDGAIVYYGLYNKSEKFYACLYDHRTLWDRLCMALPAAFHPFHTFTMKDIEINMPNIFEFLDAAIVVYSKDGKLVKRLFTKRNYDGIKNLSMFGYAIAEDEDNNELDLTILLNEFGICDSLTCGDLVRIFSSLHDKTAFKATNFTALKCMKVATLEDELFKEEDTVFSNDGNE
jgi:hypothetical protein